MVSEPEEEPMRFYCQHWDWGKFLFSILYSIPRSQVPSPKSQSLDNLTSKLSSFNQSI